MKPTDDSTLIQEAFYFHFDHFKTSENELSKKRLQPQHQPSRLQLKADFEKYNDIQARAQNRDFSVDLGRNSYGARLPKTMHHSARQAILNHDPSNIEFGLSDSKQVFSRKVEKNPK